MYRYIEKPIPEIFLKFHKMFVHNSYHKLGFEPDIKFGIQYVKLNNFKQENEAIWIFFFCGILPSTVIVCLKLCVSCTCL